MPIFCFVVNFVYGEKLVPITRRISTSIGPVAVTIALKWMDERSENVMRLDIESTDYARGSTVHQDRYRQYEGDLKRIPHHN